jgi:hypothetical protein
MRRFAFPTKSVRESKGQVGQDAANDTRAHVSDELGRDGIFCGDRESRARLQPPRLSG